MRTTTTFEPLRGLADVFCERAILGLLLIILVYGPLILGAVRPLEFSVIEGLTVAILGLWAVRVWTKSRYKLLWPPICWAVIAVALYAIIRCHLAEMPAMARPELHQVLVYTALFFAIVNNVNRRESATVVTVVLIAMAVGLSVFAFYQFGTRSPHIWNFEKPPLYCARGTGTFINPNHFAGFLEMILPLSLAFTVMSRFSHALKAVLGYASLVIAVGIVVSLSRGGMSAAAAAVVLYLVVLLFQRDYRLPAILMLAVAGILAVVFVNKFPEVELRFQHTGIATAKAEKPEDDRVIYWKMAAQVWEKQIFFGVAPGHFDQEFRPYQKPNIGRPEYVHNDYLQTLCEWGVAGFALICAALVFLFAGIKKTWRFVQPNAKDMGSKTSTKAAFLLGGSFGLAAMLIHSFLDYNMHIPSNAIVAVVLIAMLSAQMRFASERYWITSGLLGKILFSLLALGAMGFMADHAFQKAQASIAFEQADKLNLYSDKKIELLKKAAQIEPDNFETAYTLGECLRLKSWQGQEGYRTQAQEALIWFQTAMKLNPYDPFCPLRYGMCLDWLDRPAEATPYFKRACALDPRGTYCANYEGWHYLQLDDFAEAKKSFQRSLSISYTQAAVNYCEIANKELAKIAAQKGK